MAGGVESVVLRPMTAADVPRVVEVQEPASVRALSGVFPQHRFPFPRQTVQQRWLAEIETPGIDCFVVEVGPVVVGFAATRGDELLHFGIAVEHWGSGVAQAAHDHLLAHLGGAGVRQAWLRVFTGNGRGRRFYERLGWVDTGERSRSTFPPNPELMRYERALSP